MDRRAALFAAFLTMMAPAIAANAPITEITANDAGAHVFVATDKGQLLHLDKPYKRVSVGSREIADVQAMSDGMLYVVGKKAGSTNLTFRGNAGDVVAVVDLVVTNTDVSGLASRLKAAMPNENLTVTPSGDGIVLSGQVSSPDHLKQAVALAERFAPGKITNMIGLAGSQQVLLEVKFAEVARTALKHITTATNLNYLAANGGAQILTGPALPLAIDTANSFGGIAGGYHDNNWDLKAGFEALERKGLIRTLAEPNLVALSGDTASFLAGGEFPIPVAQSAMTAGAASTVTVEYKDYGVGLAFTPTIISRDLVNLMLRSEVSSIDDSLAVKANGFVIPALKTRRARTTIELHDGQSFAIAGLLQDDFSNATEKMPLLGDVPVLGSLFRSPSYTHNQTDLVIIVTVHLVQPTVAARLSTPIDTLKLPTEIDHFGVSGRIEKTVKSKPESAIAPVREDTPKADDIKKDKEGYALP
jgi:pilus assembly protein CpaC